MKILKNDTYNAMVQQIATLSNSQDSIILWLQYEKTKLHDAENAQLRKKNPKGVADLYFKRQFVGELINRIIDKEWNN